jgi:hypothetical protein
MARVGNVDCAKVGMDDAAKKPAADTNTVRRLGFIMWRSF